MPDPNEDLAAKLAEIKFDYLRRLRDEWLHGLAAFRALPFPSWSKEQLEKLVFHAHSATGSGAIFGYQALSDHARELEDHSRCLVGQAEAMSESQHAEIVRLIDQLRATCQEALNDLALS